jgi:polysaccharide pyruvyl transferase WcaK-like protein
VRKREKQQSVIIWNMSYAVDADNPNLGDAALVWSLLKTLKREIAPSPQVFLFCNHKIGEDVLSSEIKVNSVEYKLTNLPMILKTIMSCHFFILGGGEFLSDRSHRLYSVFNLIPALLAKFFGKPIIAYGIGVDDPANISLLAKVLARNIFGSKDVITVRDSFSNLAISQLGLKSRVFNTTDAAIGLVLDERFFHNLSNVSHKENVVILAPRLPFPQIKNSYANPLTEFLPIGVRLRRGLLPNTFLKARGKFLGDMAKIVDYLTSRYGVKCLLLPAYKGALSYGDESICEEIKSLSDKNGQVEVIKVQKPTDVMYLIKGARLLIGVPLHSLILSLIVGTPFIGLSYHPKITKFLKETKMYDFCLHVDGFESWAEGLPLQEIFHKIDEAFCDSPDISNKLAQQLTKLVAKEQIGIGVLKSFLCDGMLDNSA